MTLLPPGLRSRTAHGLTAAAARGRFALQVCAECGAAAYPPRDACARCLSARLAFRDLPAGGTVLAETTIRVSGDGYFRPRLPWRIGTVALDCGPSMVAHLHGEVAEGARVRMTWRLDRSGSAVAFAMPDPPTPQQQDDSQLREMTCDPRGRRVLVTDGRTDVGQAMARAMVAAGAATVFVGIAAPFAAEAALRALPQIEVLSLDITDGDSVAACAAAIGSRVDILVNTAGHPRPGGILEDTALATARAAMELRCFGLLRLAQALAPAMRAPAVAWVNLLSVQALMSWPDYAATATAEAACLSASQALRAALRGDGIRVVHVFAGPLDTESFQAVPPPKVTPAALAAATVAALAEGLEEVFVGDVARELRARLEVQPKAVERELGG
jgi:NAD(P)-dependent dehydrogenase (short-subunit alcohol dehydrogenase family)/uncharacterized OB-fold protein